MASSLRLPLTDYQGPNCWRCVLEDEAERSIADHQVDLDTECREYRGFLNLVEFLDYHKPIRAIEAQLEELGGWIGRHIFGDVCPPLLERAVKPAVLVHVIVPDAAQELLFRPFELARFPDDHPTIDQDPDALTVNVDPNSAQLIRHILDLLTDRQRRENVGHAVHDDSRGPPIPPFNAMPAASLCFVCLTSPANSQEPRLCREMLAAGVALDGASGEPFFVYRSHGPASGVPARD